MATNRIENKDQISYAWFTYNDYQNGKLYYEGPIDKSHPNGVYELNGKFFVFKQLKEKFEQPKSDFIIRDFNYLILLGNEPLNAVSFSIDDNYIFCSIKFSANNQLNETLLKWAIEKLGKDADLKSNTIKYEVYLSDKETIKFLENFGFEKQYEIISDGSVIYFLNILPTEYYVFTKLSYFNNIYYKYTKQNFVQVTDASLNQEVTQFRKNSCKGNMSEISIIQIINKNIKVLVGIDNKQDKFEIDQFCTSPNIDLLDIFKVILFALNSYEKLNLSKHSKISISLNINKDLELKETLEKLGFTTTLYKNNQVNLECSLPWNVDSLNITTLKVGNRYKSIAENSKFLENYPSLSTWLTDHLIDLSYSIASFFNYLSIERIEQGFLQIKNDDVLSVKPQITYEQVKYVLSEIFPCGDMLKENNYSIGPIPSEISTAIRETIVENINNKNLLNKVDIEKKKSTVNDQFSIEERALQLVWNYLSNGINTLFYSGIYSTVTNSEIDYKIRLAQQKGFNRRFSSQNYGFQLDVQNCAFQAILYVCVSLVDWLETSNIGYEEVSTAYKILVPVKRQTKLPEPNKELNPDSLYVKIISNAIIERELTPLSDGINLIIFILEWFSKKLQSANTEDNFKTISRFMIFANPV